MDTAELIQRLSVALAIGFLIGLERGWQSRNEREGERAAGLRTHTLAGVLGGVWGLLTLSRGDAGTIALALAFATFSAAIIFFRLREAVADGTFGATTVVAAMLAFALGAYAVAGDTAAAAATGVAVAGLLALKSALHAFVGRLSWIELRSGLLLLAMTFILLPLLPNRTVDPWDALNPFELWLMTILIAAISFAGYIAIRLMGEQRGIIATGVAGGLVSSTAVTVTLARLAEEHPAQRDQLLAGALLSSATMAARVLVVVAAIGVALLPRVVLPIALLGLTLTVAGLLFLKAGAPDRAQGKELRLTNPFELKTVLQFGALLTVITLLAKLLVMFAGSAGAYALAAVSGIADVDAVTLSMSRLGADLANNAVAANAILLAVGVNTIAKAVLGWMTGGVEVGQRLLAVAVLAVAAGIAGWLLPPIQLF